MTAMHVVHATVTPPARYPDIITLAITSYSFIIFFSSFLLVNYRQWEDYFNKMRPSTIASIDSLSADKSALKVKHVKRE